jgi:hypothetical protein
MMMTRPRNPACLTKSQATDALTALKVSVERSGLMVHLAITATICGVEIIHKGKTFGWHVTMGGDPHAERGSFNAMLAAVRRWAAERAGA